MMGGKINTSDVKIINSYLSESNILKAKDYITIKCGDVIDSNSALPILITLCRTVSENSDINNENDILYIANICSKSLSTLKDEEKIETFLLSLYHIFKYFCKRKSLMNILAFINFVKQYGINQNFKSDIYNYYTITLYNYIIDCSQQISPDYLHNITLYCLRIHKQLKKFDFANFFSKVKAFCIIYKYPAINNTHRDEFCVEVLNLFEKLSITPNKNNAIEIYTLLFRLFNITTYCLSASEGTMFPSFITNHFKYILSLMKRFCSGKEYKECIYILECFSHCVLKKISSHTDKDSEMLSQCNKKLKAFIRKFNANHVVVISCREFQKVFRIFFEYFQNCKDLWNEHFPVSLQLEILRTIEIIGHYLLNISTDKCSGNCKSETDNYFAAILTVAAGIFVSNSLRMNMVCPDEFHTLSLRCLTTCCKIIREHQLTKCSKFLSLWKMAGSSLYNTSVILYRKKEYKLSKLYSHTFIINLISIEGVQNPEICFPNSLGASLHLYAICCHLLKEKKEAMLYLSLIILLSSEYKKQALQTWVTLKSALDNDDNEYKLKTIYHILFEEQDSIKQIYPSYIYSSEVCEELLMEELQYYFKNWQSRGSFNSVCNEICKISKNINYRTKCFVITWEKVITMLDVNYTKNLISTIALIESSANTNNKIYLSVLYYILYQCKMQQIIDTNIADMNEAYIPLKSTPLQPYEEPPNPNDKCDIVPSFYNMKLDNLLKIYAFLNKFLEIWDELFKGNEHKLDPNIISEMNIDKIMKLIAYEYRMQHFNIHMLKAWILYYKFGKKFNNKIAIITSIGFLIEYLNCKSKIICDLEKEAEDLLNELNKNDADELETYITYYVNKSTGYLNYNFVEEGYTYLCTAMKHIETIQKLNLKTCEARILFLKTQYLLLPCANKIMEHDENFLITAQNSFSVIAEHYSKNGRCPYLLSILFEISLGKGWMYKWLRLPREVRCYTKETILLAQKFVLPIRTAQFLSLLAFTDLLDLQYSDCEVKLNGLTNMLCYTSNCTFEKLSMQSEITKDREIEIKDCQTSDLDYLIPEIQIVLDTPASYYKTNNVMCSPELRRKPFCIPEFAKHSNNCGCFMCLNFEYQKLILDTIHLEALLNLYQRVNLHGEEYFKGGLTLYEKLYKKSNLKTITFFENDSVFGNVYNNILQSYCYFLLNYSYFLIQRSTHCDAKKVVDNIYKLLRNVNFTNVFFLSELNIQKLNLYYEPEIEEESSNNEENELKTEINAVNSLTPTNKLSATNSIIPISPAVRPSRVKSFKKITFDFSDQENNSSDKSKTPEGNKNMFIKLQTPAKTPVPSTSKIKIYTPRTVKPKRSKTTVTTTLSPIKISTEMKKTVNKQLEERTKLLTQKLKAEKEAVVENINNFDTVNKKLYVTKNTNTKLSLCKKLLNDLDEITESVDKLSINSAKSKTKKGKQESTNIPKRYTRIKKAPPSSSDSSSENSTSQRITRTRKEN